MKVDGEHCRPNPRRERRERKQISSLRSGARRASGALGPTLSPNPGCTMLQTRGRGVSAVVSCRV
jgi:hypothetical protein